MSQLKLSICSLSCPHLIFGWYLAREKKIEHALRQRLLPSLRLGQQLLALGDAVAAESDAFLGIEQRSLRDQTSDTSHASIHLVVQMKMEDREKL